MHTFLPTNLDFENWNFRLKSISCLNQPKPIQNGSMPHLSGEKGSRGDRETKMTKKLRTNKHVSVEAHDNMLKKGIKRKNK
jgi:hypothetical protein